MVALSLYGVMAVEEVVVTDEVWGGLGDGGLGVGETEVTQLSVHVVGEGERLGVLE